MLEAMKPVREALLQAYAEDVELQQLPLAMGKNPKRQPPSENAIDKARALVAKALKVPAKEAALEYMAGKWRYKLIGAVQRMCDDPDTVLDKWLKEGAPMGIT